MSYLAYHKNKKTGVTYVYEVKGYWNKNLNQPRNKQICIGKLDPETGEIIPSKRLDPARLSQGETHFLIAIHGAKTMIILSLKY